MRVPNIQQCYYVPFSELKCFFEGDQASQFLDSVSDGGEITWGNCNRSLASIEKFMVELTAATDPLGANIQIARITELNDFLEELRLKEAYIDFEN